MSTVQAGLISPTDLRDSVVRLLEHRFRLGLFDPMANQTYTQGIWNSTDSVHSAAHAQLALEAALQSMVRLVAGGKQKQIFSKKKKQHSVTAVRLFQIQPRIFI